MHEYNDFGIGGDNVAVAGVTSGVAVSCRVAQHTTYTSYTHTLHNT